MRVLYVSYSTWKSVVQFNGFVVYEQATAAASRHVWAGTRDVIYRSDITPALYADYDAAFVERVQVPEEDEALAQILGLATVLTPRQNNTPIVRNEEFTLGQLAFTRVDNGTEQMNIDGTPGGTPVNIWDGTGGGDSGTSDWSTSGVGSETAGSNHSGTNGWDTGVTAEGNQTVFDNGSMIDVAGSYSTVRFWMQPKAFPTNSRPRIMFANASNKRVGNSLRIDDYTTNMDLDVWQQVTIPIDDFALTGNAQKLRLRYANTAGQHYWFDEFEFLPITGAPYRFEVRPGPGHCYHISMLVLIVAGPSGSWSSTNFGNISPLTNGLLLRQRRLSDGEVLWRFNSKDNSDLFGRYHPQDDITFSDGSLLIGFMIKPGKASVVVTDDTPIQFVVRDDLSGLTSARAFAHFGLERVNRRFRRRQDDVVTLVDSKVVS